MDLRPEQRAAVERTGQDVCVVAGPGSGKTRVLVERFRWRIQDSGYSPLRILAVTFTDKAATQLKQRLAKDFRALPELREQIERAPVSTVHGFCARLLKEHVIEAGLDPGFQVLEAPEATSELRAAADEILDALLEERPEAMRRLLAGVDFSNLEPAEALSRVFEARRLLVSRPQGAARCGAAEWESLCEALRGIAAAAPSGWNDNQRAELAQVQAWCRRVLALPPASEALEGLRLLAELRCDLRRLKRGHALTEAVKQLREELVPAARQALMARHYAAEHALLEEGLARLEARYRERKGSALDFADLEELAIRLLRDNPALRQKVRESFDEILMDELQDTNPLQAALIDLVRRPGRFFAVGDINQSIFGFRHAEPEVFRRYRRELEARGEVVDRLQENHRSRQEILDTVETILGGAPGIEAHKLVAVGEFAEKREPPVEVIAAVAETTEEAAALEAQWVARRIRDLVEAGVADFSQVAVLVRNVQALVPFEEAFHAFDVPYVLARGKGFYEAQESADLTHWLRVLVNARDEISLAAVLRSPLAGVSDETLVRLKQRGHLAEALAQCEECAEVAPAERERLVWLREQLQAQRTQRDETPPDRLLAAILDASGYEESLSARARANLRRFRELVRDWFTRRPRPLAELVEELADRRTADPDEAAAPAEDALNAVQVLTMHAAKGLEFPVVFVAALHKGVRRDSPPLASSPEAGLAARWRDPVTGQGTPDSDYATFDAAWKQKMLEEESRLFYVAMTRAKEHLVLSFAASQKGAAEWAGQVVSRLGVDLLGNGTEGSRVRIRCVREAPQRPVPRAPAPAEEGAGRLARPALTGQYDSSAAVTSVALFQECPRQYFLARYLGWELLATPPLSEPRASANGDLDETGPDAVELGRQVHDLLAGFPVPEPAPEACELAERFLASQLASRVARAERVEREFDFLLEVEKVVLQGRIDLWFEEGGELVLVDYKTDDVAVAEAAERARAYALQLQLYALALERAAGRLPDRAFIYLLRPDLAVPVNLRAEDFEAARAAVRALRQAQEEMRFPVRTGAHCARCAYFAGLCPARAAA